MTDIRVKAQAYREKEEQMRQAYGEAYAKEVIAKYPSLAPLYDHYVWEGKQRWIRRKYEEDPSKSWDFTSTFAYLESKSQPSFHTYLEEMWQEETYENEHGDLQFKRRQTPQEEPEEEDRPMTRAEKMRNRPCVGCPDCRHWDVWKCECTNPNPKPEICDWISERYMEKAE